MERIASLRGPGPARLRARATLGVRLAIAAAVAIASGCAPSPPAATPIEKPAPPPGAPVDAAGVTPIEKPGAQLTGIQGRATVDGQPFAGATTRVFRLADGAPVATGTVAEDGRYRLDFGTAVAPGTPIKVVASRDGKTLVGAAATMVAAGGGNLVAAGGGNIVAAGGGNMVAAGGGNMVAAGGGNIVAAGGLNYALTQDAPGLLLDEARTVATLLLLPRLRGAAIAAERDDGRLDGAVLQAIEEIVDRLVEKIDAVLDRLPDEAIAALLDAPDAVTGEGSFDQARLASLVAADATFDDAVVAAADEFGSVIATAVAAGGEPPPSETTATFAVGDAMAPAIELPAANAPIEPPPAPVDEPVPGEPTAPAPVSGGGGSSDEGAVPADEDLVDLGTDLLGNLTAPRRKPVVVTLGGSLDAPGRPAVALTVGGNLDAPSRPAIDMTVTGHLDAPSRSEVALAIAGTLDRPTAQDGAPSLSQVFASQLGREALVVLTFDQPVRNFLDPAAYSFAVAAGAGGLPATLDGVPDAGYAAVAVIDGGNGDFAKEFRPDPARTTIRLDPQDAHKVLIAIRDPDDGPFFRGNPGAIKVWVDPSIIEDYDGNALTGANVLAGTF